MVEEKKNRMEFYDIEKSLYRSELALSLGEYLRLNLTDYGEPVLLPSSPAGCKRWRESITVVRYLGILRRSNYALSNCIKELRERYQQTGEFLPAGVSIDDATLICQSWFHGQLKYPLKYRKGKKSPCKRRVKQ